MPKRASRTTKPRSNSRTEKPVADQQRQVNFTPTLLIKKLQVTRPNQIAYFKSMETNVITFGLGHAGSGKSYMAVWFAARALSENKIDRLIITRPLVQCGGDQLGFLPGDLNNKVAQPMRPVLDVLLTFFSSADINKLLDADKLRITPIGYMRGSSFKNTIIIVDEAQNCTSKQLNMVMTRIDYGSKLIFTGDEFQSDIGDTPPIVEKVKKLSEPKMLDDVGLVRFTRADNMRPDLVARVCERLGI